MKKNDFEKLFKKYQPMMKKTGDQLSKAMKSAEEDLGKAYKVAQTHVEIQMKNLQKEKLYYDLGKFVAAKLEKDSLDVTSLDKYKKQLTRLSSEGAKIKRKLSHIGTTGKKKTSNKKASKKK